MIDPRHGHVRPKTPRAVELPSSDTRARSAVDAEMRFHIEGRVEELMASGVPRDEAERQAREAFGDVDRIGAEVERIDRTTRRRRAFGAWRHTLVWDIRYALRGIVRKPVFSIVIVLTLALGIGANAAIFSAVEGVLLRPLRTPWLDELVVVQSDLPGISLRNTQLSPAEARDLFARKDLFSSGAGYTQSGFNLAGDEGAERVTAAQTLGDFFGTLGGKASIGRLYRPEDSENGGHRVAVLSHDLWQRLSGGDRALVGRTIELSGEQYEVIGVAAEGFRFPRSAELWTPFAVTPNVLSRDQRMSLYMDAVVRVRAGMSPVTLANGLADETRRWHERYEYNPEYKHALLSVPLTTYLAGALRPVLLVLVGAVAFVLLIACTNVASLQLVRTMAREKEIALRSALGAGRGAIARQLLVENLILYLGGGLLGIVVGRLALRAIAKGRFGDLPLLHDLRLDSTVLAFAGIVTLVAGLLFGVVPALRAVRVDAQDVLKEQGRSTSLGAREKRFIRASVVAQMALALVLLLGSALTIQSLTRLLEVDPGFRPQQVTSMRLALSGASAATRVARVGFYERLAGRLAAIPGIISVGFADGVPFGDGGSSSPLHIRGMPEVEGQPQRHANIRAISGDYFRTMGIPLIRGRLFDATDRLPLYTDAFRFSAIIDETIARKYFGTVDPIGKEISQGPDAVVVGVVGSVRNEKLGDPAYPTVYYLYRQYNWLSTLYLTVRSTLETDAITRLVQSAVRELDPRVPIFDVRPMRERVEQSLGERRLAVTVLSGFAVLSIVLAALGVYGVISYSMSQRTREFGIRIAVGARSGDVLRMVMRNGATLAVGGTVVGVLAFLALGRLMASMLYGVGPRDVKTMVGGVVLLFGVALLACFGPARRASRVDPIDALRTD